MASNFEIELRMFLARANIVRPGFLSGFRHLNSHETKLDDLSRNLTLAKFRSTRLILGRVALSGLSQVHDDRINSVKCLFQNDPRDIDRRAEIVAGSEQPLGELPAYRVHCAAFVSSRALAAAVRSALRRADRTINASLISATK